MKSQRKHPGRSEQKGQRELVIVKDLWVWSAVSDGWLREKSVGPSHTAALSPLQDKEFIFFKESWGATGEF